MRRLAFLMTIGIAVLGLTFPVMYSEARDPNTPRSQRAENFLAETARTPPPRDPNVPKLVRQTLASQILPVGADWMMYYDIAPRDTVQVYYNLNVFLNVLRLQELQIKQLTERVAALEKKLTIDANAPMVTK